MKSEEIENQDHTCELDGCDCEETCDNGEKCDCGCGQHKCDCQEHECKCGAGGHESCGCSGDCHCGENCHCHDGERCSEDCDCQEENVHVCCEHGNEYLDLARHIQADFDNFRRHAIEDIKKAKVDGQLSVIEAFLPCLDVFKEAKKSITDENMLKGVEMIENKIVSALEVVGVKKLESIGEVYDPYKHDAIAVVSNAQFENDVIIDEYQSGYEFNGKIIREAKVIVNKI